MDYTVKPGDTLSKIARDQLGDMQLWQEIALRNGIQSPYIIEPGQVLRLTDDPPEVVRRVEPGLTITATPPSRFRFDWKWIFWAGLAGATVYFLFPPQKRRLAPVKVKRRRTRARARRLA